MPTYDYRCEKCGDFEAYQSIKDAALTVCPTCGGPVAKLISRNVNLIFKGSGFHITDYRNDSYKSAAKADSVSGSNGANKSGASNSGSNGSSTSSSASSAGSSSKA